MAAVGRAESYGVTRFHDRIGPNEHSIPAVRSLDGGLIYFTDATGENTSGFETDFNMVGDSIVRQGPPGARGSHCPGTSRGPARRLGAFLSHPARTGTRRCGGFARPLRSRAQQSDVQSGT